nr:ribonuclease H-like domain-containing protein [Tanacetum cinerariifolium]
MNPYNHSTPISTKLPILDTGKFEQWKFRIQQYLQRERYALWEVIEFGDSYKAPPEETTKYKGLAGEIDDYDIEEMDIKWNLALLSMKANRFWKKTGKKITIQGSDVAGFDKSKVECFNCHMMGHFTRECRSPRSQDRGMKESYKKDPKVEEPAPKNHALMANEEEVPIEYALISKSSSSSDNEMGLPEFVDDTVTDYTRPTPSIDVSKSPMIKFMKESGCPNATKVNNTENARKPTVKYAEMHMTSNISYLSEYEPFNGGYVLFGHGRGKITGKGSIKTGDNVVDLLTKAFDVGRVETTDGETKILAKVNGRQRTVSESSIKRHLKLNDEEDETAFPTGDVRYGEAFPTVTCLDAVQYRENIAKTFAMPYEALPRVTSLGGGGCSKHGGMDQGEDLLVGDTVRDSDKSVDKGSDSMDEMANVLSTLGATNILASGGLRSVFTIASLSVATASTGVSLAVATASRSFSTATIFTTASVATPTTRVTRSSRGVVIGSSSPISVNIPSISKKDKGKGKMTEPKQPSKEKVLEQMKLDKSNEMVAKYLSEYEQAKARLSHDEKGELIDELLMYQRHLAQIKKYQAQQNKPATKTERRNFYMSILRSNVGWKAKDFKGMTFEHIEVKFILMCINAPTADVYIAKKFATIEEFALLHEDKIYSESKTRVCYI